MQEQVSRGPLSHTTLLWVVGAGRVPVVTATIGRPGEVRLAVEAIGAGYGATVVLVGPAEILAQIVADLGGALEGVTP